MNNKSHFLGSMHKRRMKPENDKRSQKQNWPNVNVRLPEIAEFFDSAGFIVPNWKMKCGSSSLF